MKRLVTAGFLVLIFSLLLVAPAYAYLDPGTGSYICQLLLAGVLGAMFVIKLYWSKVKAFFSGLFKSSKE